MPEFTLLPQQKAAAELPADAKVFLYGANGCGKTAAGVERVRYLLDHAEPFPEVIVFSPSRTLARPYADAVSESGLRAKVTTYNGFIQHSLELFWPMIAEKTAFALPEKKPHFLTIETAQVLMYKTVREKMDEGYFGALTSSAGRIFNQVMISMRKCAGAEIPYETYAARMRQSWGGDSGLLSVFDQAQECGMIFRDICLQHNLLDYALQVETFNNYLLPLEAYRDWLKAKQIHFIYDNVEEDVPAAHHLAKELIRLSRSAFVIQDSGGGHRSFLGCDPISAETLRTCCDTVIGFDQSVTCSSYVTSLKTAIRNPKLSNRELGDSPRRAFTIHTAYQYPDMVKQAVTEVADLVHVKGVDPSDIVILAPLVSDVLYASMERELREQNIRVYLHRPSRPLINEQITGSMITLCALVHPYHGIEVRMLDIVRMMQTLIPALDPMRGHLLVGKAFVPDKEWEGWYDLKRVEDMPESVQKRIPSGVAEAYGILRSWILQSRAAAKAETPDQLICRFFREIMIRDGFTCNEEVNLGVKKIIESAGNFRRLLDDLAEMPNSEDPSLPSWDEFFRMVGIGMVSANYYEEWFAQPKDSVLISLTSAYLSMDRPAKYQIWLNAGSPRWWERFYGQLTNDAVLSTQWAGDEKWTAVQVMQANDLHMKQQICGLLDRCGMRISLFSSELSESGQNQKSNLLYLFSTLDRRFSKDKPTEPDFFDFPQKISEDDPVYPGINDEYEVGVDPNRGGSYDL